MITVLETVTVLVGPVAVRAGAVTVAVGWLTVTCAEREVVPAVVDPAVATDVTVLRVSTPPRAETRSNRPSLVEVEDREYRKERQTGAQHSTGRGLGAFARDGRWTTGACLGRRSLSIREREVI